MLRAPKSYYEFKRFRLNIVKALIECRSKTLLKVKTFYDAEAKVIAYQPAEGREHLGELSNLSVVSSSEVVKLKG
jgi:hypothetical protein